MIGFKVMTRQGLRGPYMKSSILKAIEGGIVPLKAKLLDLHTNRFIVAADLVGVEVDEPASGKAAPAKPAATAKAQPPASIKPVKLPMTKESKKRNEKEKAADELAAKSGKPAAKAAEKAQPAKKKSSKVVAPDKKNVGSGSQADFHDTTLMAPVDANITLGRPTTQAAPPPIDPIMTEEIGQLSHLTDLILTEDDDDFELGDPPGMGKNKKK